MHGDFDDLYASSFYCDSASFLYTEFDEQWAGVCSISNLSFITGSFTTLNDVSAETFDYISGLTSNAQLQINNTSNVLSNLSNTVASVSRTAVH